MRSEGRATVLVLAAPRDAQLTCRVLEQAGVTCVRCHGAAEFFERLGDEAGAAVIAEEALDDRFLKHLMDRLARQPTWSDFPILVVTQAQHAASLLPSLAMLGNASMLTRPMAPDALASAAAAALRARERQFQVRRLLDEQRELMRRKDELLMMLAHELRNPLAPVRYAAETLRSGRANARQAEASVEVIARQVEHMGRIIDQLLEVFRASRGLVRLELGSVDLAALAREAAEAHAMRRAGEVRCEAAGPVWVRGDRPRLRQVLDNLVENAIKFSPPQEPIVVSVMTDGDEAVLEVRDHGSGFERAAAEQLWEPFAQADHSLDRAGGGLGLGLALVRALAQLHGGRVAAESDGPGKGSRFEVRLPRAEAPALVEPAAGAAAPGRSALRVLIAEDNVDAAEALRLLLELHGHAVRVEHDGEGAVAAALRERPDVLVCDIGLPRLNGYEVARALRADVRTDELRLIAVTGYGTAEDRDRALEAGFDLHLAKPVDPALLIAEVARAGARVAP